MKRGRWNIAGLAIVWMLLTSSCYSTRMNDGSQGAITYQTFYDQLSPYGTWIDYLTYRHVGIPTLADGKITGTTSAGKLGKQEQTTALAMEPVNLSCHL